MTFRDLSRRLVSADLKTASGRAIVEERYMSLRQQVPIVYLLGFVNLAGMELATGSKLAPGLNLPTFIAACALLRLAQWYWVTGSPDHRQMVARMAQTVLFASIVCLAVCARCLFLLTTGDEASHMAVMLFGGLTAIGVSYGLTALPMAGRIPLLLIVVPISAKAVLARDAQFAWAAFALVVVSALTIRLLAFHNRHLTDLIRSRALVRHQQSLAESAHQEAVVAATTDFLTSLPNRRAFVSAVEDAIADQRAGKHFAVGLLDLNRFKAINDTFGHEVGDRLLQEVASRLLVAVGEGGLVARLGGDEFGLLWPAIATAEDARAAGGWVLSGVNRPVTIEDREFEVSGCCGIALAERTGDWSPSRALADADLALYEAKDAEAGAVIFNHQMEAPRHRRVKVEHALRTVGMEENLSLVFQPIVNLKTGRVIAQEALARWTDPELGAVAPSEFVPIAEQLNIIDRINNHLMELAFAEARSWPRDVNLSFNLSAVQLCSPGFAGVVIEKLKAAGLETCRLQAEVTETALLADFERARQNLTALRSHGVTIVLDDFGAGYASIGYLRELRFDQIKLDGTLVTAAQFSSDGKRLLRAVIGLCDLLGVSSIAEHIESEELLELVVGLGCSCGQGFWLHQPVPANAVQGLNQIVSLLPGSAKRRAMRGVAA